MGVLGWAEIFKGLELIVGGFGVDVDVGGEVMWSSCE